MPSESFASKPRELKPRSATGLSADAHETVNATLKAMLTWRNELADANKRNGKRVIEQMAAAAATLGWPEQIVDAARTQLQSIVETQTTAMDQMMDAWEEQLKQPDPMSASPSAMLSKLKSLPGFGQTGNWPGAEAFQNAAINPFQFWMQVGQQWQKSCADMMAAWSKTTKLH